MSETQDLAAFVQEHPAAATLVEAMRVGWETYYASHAALLEYAIPRLPGDTAQVFVDRAAASVRHAAANETITIEQLRERLHAIAIPVIDVLAGLTPEKKDDVDA